MRRLKEFELWFKKKKVGYSHAAYYTDKYEDGWRAALEWVLKDLYTPLSPTAAETIRGELNGKTQKKP
jgi:hypothetical protein